QLEITAAHRLRSWIKPLESCRAAIFDAQPPPRSLHECVGRRGRCSFCRCVIFKECGTAERAAKGDELPTLAPIIEALIAVPVPVRLDAGELDFDHRTTHAVALPHGSSPSPASSNSCTKATRFA